MNEPNIQKKSHYLPGSTFATGIVAHFIDRVLGNLYYEKKGGGQIVALVDDDQDSGKKNTDGDHGSSKNLGGCGSWITETSLWVTYCTGNWTL